MVMSARKREVWDSIRFHAIDKNCVFTPPHIGDVMCELTGVSNSSVVLDPCCGPGALLEVAGTYGTDKLFGIEYLKEIRDSAVSDGVLRAENIVCDSCFNSADFIRRVDPDVVLMNPPYNADGKSVEFLTNKKAKQDPTKGLAFVLYTLELMTHGMLAVILPTQCGTSGFNPAMQAVREKILENNTLVATFTLPTNLFVPAASVSTALYLFRASVPHSGKTFVGNVPDDGFDANLRKGRYERTDGAWDSVHDEMMNLYRSMSDCDDKSVCVDVTAECGWLYDDHKVLDTIPTHEDFLRTVNEYMKWKICNMMDMSMARAVEQMKNA